MVEPRQDFRNMAMGLYELYAAYVQAGFSEEQAFRMILASMPKSGE